MLDVNTIVVDDHWWDDSQLEERVLRRVWLSRGYLYIECSDGAQFRRERQRSGAYGPLEHVTADEPAPYTVH